MLHTRQFFMGIVPLIFAFSVMANNTDMATDRPPSKANASGGQARDAQLFPLMIDTRDAKCTEPLPQKDTVDSGLSFTQTRTCRVSLKRPDNFMDNCTFEQGQRICFENPVTITISNTEIGTRVTKNASP